MKLLNRSDVDEMLEEAESRLEELEAADNHEDTDDWQETKDKIETLKGVLEAVGEDGWPLIPESDFKEYAQDLAEETMGSRLDWGSWPLSCIDWEQVADELRHDYSTIELDGEDYYYRSW